MKAYFKTKNEYNLKTKANNFELNKSTLMKTSIL